MLKNSNLTGIIIKWESYSYLLKISILGIVYLYLKISAQNFDNMWRKIPLFCLVFGALSVSQVLNVSKKRICSLVTVYC